MQLQTRVRDSLNQPRPRRSAFSLIELTLVLVIIGVLTAVAAWNIMGQGTNAKIQATKNSMSVIKNGLDQYQLQHNSFPVGLAALATANILDGTKMKDGWKREFYYATPGINGRPFDLMSGGADTTRGTADDIEYWRDIAEAK
jgi:general secretion pathway protein G